MGHAHVLARSVPALHDWQLLADSLADELAGEVWGPVGLSHLAQLLAAALRNTRHAAGGGGDGADGGGGGATPRKAGAGRQAKGAAAEGPVAQHQVCPGALASGAVVVPGPQRPRRGRRLEWASSLAHCRCAGQGTLFPFHRSVTSSDSK